MSQIILSGTNPGPETASLYLLIAPHPAVDRLMDTLAVRLALAANDRMSAGSDPARSERVDAGSPHPYLRILDGGNRFDLHGIARGIHAGGIHAGSMYAADSLQMEAILQHIIVARAFTCYQMEALLAGSAAAGGATSPPVLAPGLLTTFADENVHRSERLRLLARCILHLKRLAQHAPVLVSAAPLPPGADAEFLARLETAAGQVWRFEAAAGAGPVVGAGGRIPSAAPGQLRLF